MSSRSIELLSSTLGPGGTTFGAAIVVDGDIRQGLDANPELAMSSTGQADVVYRVVRTEANGPAVLRAGDVDEEVRVAHFVGERWSALGAINRDPGVAMRPPTQANAPQIAIGPTGNGVVVWQEPEVNGVARIWARRLFGSSLDYVMLVSATTFAGAPIGEDSDAPSVAFTRLGQAEVAYRQAAGAGSPLPGLAHLRKRSVRRRIVERLRVPGRDRRRLLRAGRQVGCDRPAECRHR